MTTASPTRHPIDFENPEYYDKEKLDAETRRVFDVCHGCRRCFNLCDSFPKLFDLIDESKTGELDSVDSKDFEPVVDACTLCDMCFVNKCPYVPPHPFNIDFPHLMLQHRAVDTKENGTSFKDKQIANMDRNGALASKVAPVVNYFTSTHTKTARTLLEKGAGIHKEAFLPPFEKSTFSRYVARTLQHKVPLENAGPGSEEKVILYANCYGNYHKHSIAEAAYTILRRYGVDVRHEYPGCCGMPVLEQGRLDHVARTAEKIAAFFEPWIDEGYKILSLTPSCTLMLKQEWPLLRPHHDAIQKLKNHTHDISDYLVKLFKKKGAPENLAPLEGDVVLHLACHSRAQNLGQKAKELLSFVPDANITVIERCSGHGGAWGVKKENFDTALKVGKPVARTVSKQTPAYVLSECPLAVEHIRQGVERIQAPAAPQAEPPKDSSTLETPLHTTYTHPLELFCASLSKGRS